MDVKAKTKAKDVKVKTKAKDFEFLSRPRTTVKGKVMKL